MSVIPINPGSLNAGNSTFYPDVFTAPNTWITPRAAPRPFPLPRDAERLRFALELIADGGLRHEDIKKIADKALGRKDTP